MSGKAEVVGVGIEVEVGDAEVEFAKVVERDDKEGKDEDADEVSDDVVEIVDVMNVLVVVGVAYVEVVVGA